MQNRKILAIGLAIITLSAGCNKKSTDGLHDAFSVFDSDNCEIYIQDDEVVIETNGLTNHTSPYWSPSHALYTSPIVTTTSDLAPGYIDDFNDAYTLRIPISPEIANSTSTRGLDL